MMEREEIRTLGWCSHCSQQRAPCVSQPRPLQNEYLILVILYLSKLKSGMLFRYRPTFDINRLRNIL